MKAIQAISLLNKILGIEIYMAAQGMDLVKAKLPDFEFGAGSKEALRVFRDYVRTVHTNRFASPDMVAAENAVADGVVLDAVEITIGNLR